MSDLLPIITSRSAVKTYQDCNRKRFHMYEAENGTPTRGWERKAMSIPLSTGIYTHLGIEVLLRQVIAGVPTDVDAAVSVASTEYAGEVEQRGIAVEADSQAEDVIDEQRAHIEAMIRAWARVRLPRWLEQYEVIEVEAEDRIALSDDVTLAVRADVVVRRKSDDRYFVVNFKTVANPDERWLRSWEVDMQLMTELLAAERRHGKVFGGVIIEGIVKGARVKVGHDLREVRDANKEVAGYIDRSPLLYGFKQDADPPLRALEYQWESTTRKGWYKFRTWREDFQHAVLMPTTHTALEYWVNWLPEEVLENLFVTVPPIMRNASMIESKVTQIVSMERSVHTGRGVVMAGQNGSSDEKRYLQDVYFPQHEGECYWPSRCPMFEMCYEPGTAEDPLGSGLYQTRHDHHAVKEPA
jgi:hypothetical protein